MKRNPQPLPLHYLGGMAYYPLTPSMVKLLDMDSMKFLHSILMP